MVFDRCKVQPGAFVACLFLAALALFPAVTTESKYVWQETIDLQLEIKYNENETTTGLSHTSESARQEASPGMFAAAPSAPALPSSDSNTASTACGDFSSVEENTDDDVAEKGQLVQNEPDSESQNLEGPEDEAALNGGAPRSVEQPEN